MKKKILKYVSISSVAILILFLTLAFIKHDINIFKSPKSVWLYDWGSDPKKKVLLEFSYENDFDLLCNIKEPNIAYQEIYKEQIPQMVYRDYSFCRMSEVKLCVSYWTVAYDKNHKAIILSDDSGYWDPEKYSERINLLLADNIRIEFNNSEFLEKFIHFHVCNNLGCYEFISPNNLLFDNSLKDHHAEIRDSNTKGKYIRKYIVSEKVYNLLIKEIEQGNCNTFGTDNNFIIVSRTDIQISPGQTNENITFYRIHLKIASDGKINMTKEKLLQATRLEL